MKKIVFFLMTLMLVLSACSSDSSSNADENDGDGSSMFDGSFSSGSLSSGDISLSSGSAKLISENDTLFFLKKFCYDQVDSNHFFYAKLKTEVPLTVKPLIHVTYNFHIPDKLVYTVVAAALEDFESDNGWYTVNMNLKDLKEEADTLHVTVSIESISLTLGKSVIDDVHHVISDLPNPSALNAGECFDFEKSYFLKDSSSIAKYEKIDHTLDLPVDTVASLDDLGKKGYFKNKDSGKAAHYVLELGKKVYCFDEMCSENPIEYPEIRPEWPENYPIYGTFTDPRDGKVYKTATVGMSEWFAQNLNYSDYAATPNLLNQSWCYDDDEANCEKYGRLYNWAAMLNLPSVYNDSALKNGEWYQGICPSGWHVATSLDFSYMWQFTKERLFEWEEAVLDAKNWTSGQDTVGGDRLGMAFLPGGYRNEDGSFMGMGNSTYIMVTGRDVVWLPSPLFTYCWRIHNDNILAFSESSMYKTMGGYVRCVKGPGVPDASPYLEFSAQE